MRHSASAIIIAVLSLSVFSIHTAYAGIIEGYVYGIVQDSTGTDTIALDSARVHGVHVDSVQEFTVFTNVSGYYCTGNLRNGLWNVTASHAGFTPQTKQWYIPSLQRYLIFYLWQSK